MGGGGSRTVEYVQAPTAQRAPDQSAEDKSFLDQQRAQMKEMQDSYKTNLEALNRQYASSQQQSNNVLQQLQASSEAQRRTSDENRTTLAAAQEASNRQLSLLSASRDQAVGQAAEARNQQATETGSMFDRLSRRRRARQTTY